jgi:hypothetical protein
VGPIFFQKSVKNMKFLIIKKIEIKNYKKLESTLIFFDQNRSKKFKVLRARKFMEVKHLKTIRFSTTTGESVYCFNPCAENEEASSTASIHRKSSACPRLLLL